MTLREWVLARFPPDGRKGATYLARKAEAHPRTIAKALERKPIGKRETACRISLATDGEVSIAELMQIEAPERDGRAA